MSLKHTHPQPQKPSRVVVIGPGGFLGTRVSKSLIADGVAVVGIGSRDIDLAAAGAGQQLRARLQKGDVVVFLSAITPDKGRDSGAFVRNIEMGRAVCEAVRDNDIAHLVYASSDAVYSFADGLVSEATPAVPVDLYGAMHRSREILLAAEARVPIAHLRFTAIYGGGDTHNSYGPNRFFRQALTDGRIPLFGGGEETRDHLYIDDADAILRAVITHGSTGILNVASGHSASFREVADMIAARAGRPVLVEPSARQNPVTHRHFDITALVNGFPTMRFTPLVTGIEKMIAGAGAKPRG
jgi:UDP-glucose 4-epimerase